MKLATILSILQKLAPLTLAEDWDNVGLLIEPRGATDIQRVLLTIDLTPRVLEEALARKAELIVAYHPPIFSGVKRLGQQNWQERVLLDAIQQGVLVYSPHTALDAVKGGINDWLADGLGKGQRSAIIPAASGSVKHTAKKAHGQGRLVELARPVSLSVLLGRIKRQLSIERLRVALPVSAKGLRVSSVALCAGAGASVLARVRADVWLSGEMRHHDVLAAVESGTCVILTEHTHSERGYLPHLARRLGTMVDGAQRIQVFVSTQDSEPLSFS